MRTQVHGSHIQNFLEDEVRYLLAPAADELNDLDFEKTYIPNPLMEEKFEKCLTYSPYNKTIVLTGLTGSGKSTLLHHVFKSHGMIPHIMGESLIIPFNFNYAVYSNVTSLFSRNMEAACGCLVEKFPKLKHIDNHSEEFFDFILIHRPDILHVKQIYPSPSKIECLQHLCENDPLAFFCCALKFYLNQADICSVRNVVVIIDDIEGIRLDVELPSDIPREVIPIKMVLEMMQCLQNKKGAPSYWSINVVIACRHYVYRLVRSTPYSVERNYLQQLEAYPVFTQYDMQGGPKISDIIDTRFKALSESGRRDEKWTTAVNVTRELIQHFNHDIGNLIEHLTLQNYRDAFFRYRELVFNKEWIQRDAPIRTSGAFSIDDIRQYKVNMASTIRALGMNESRVYNSGESIIPNLLHNSPDMNDDLFVLLAIKFFLEYTAYREVLWENHIRVSQFKSTVHKIFKSDEYDLCFKSALEYLLIHRLLLRSMDQEQRDNSGLTMKDIEQIEYVYPSNLALTLWKHMGMNSVLFEMYIDDIWLEDDNRPLRRSPFRGFDKDNYAMCLTYLKKLIKKERDVYIVACNESETDAFKQAFGTDPICLNLLNGLEASITNFFRTPDYELEGLISEWMVELRCMREECKKIID